MHKWLHSAFKKRGSLIHWSTLDLLLSQRTVGGISS